MNFPCFWMSGLNWIYCWVSSADSSRGTRITFQLSCSSTFQNRLYETFQNRLNKTFQNRLYKTFQHRLKSTGSKCFPFWITTQTVRAEEMTIGLGCGNMKLSRFYYRFHRHTHLYSNSLQIRPQLSFFETLSSLMQMWPNYCLPHQECFQSEGLALLGLFESRKGLVIKS